MSTTLDTYLSNYYHNMPPRRTRKNQPDKQPSESDNTGGRPGTRRSSRNNSNVYSSTQRQQVQPYPVEVSRAQRRNTTATNAVHSSSNLHSQTVQSESDVNEMDVDTSSPAEGSGHGDGLEQMNLDEPGHNHRSMTPTEHGEQPLLFPIRHSNAYILV